MTANESPSLSDLFTEVKSLCSDIEKSSLDFNSKEYQDKVSSCCSKLEELTTVVSNESIFSSNETIAEIPTEHLKFLLLPTMLANMTLKRKSSSPFIEEKSKDAPPSQIELLKLAKVYYRDFLNRCKDYNLTTANVAEDDVAAQEISVVKNGKPTPQELRVMGLTREEKIQRFKDKKSLEEKLQHMERDLVNADDESRRAYYLTLIEEAVLNSLDNLDSAVKEEKMLASMAALRKDPRKMEEIQNKPKAPPLKPFLITKESTQKAVFGAGYPSLPIMSVDEFYEKRKQEGWGPGAVPPPPPTGCCSSSSGSVVMEHGAGHCSSHGGRDSPPPAPHNEDSEGEQNSDEEQNKEKRERLKARDEYRDVHRRGWGNTYNRS